MAKLLLFLTPVLALSITIFIIYCYGIFTTNQTFGSAMFPESDITNLPSTIQEASSADLSKEDGSIANNNMTFNNSQISFSNNMQLTGTEKIMIGTNFSSKPFGISTDYNIDGKPVVIIDNQSLDFEYPIDNNDEVSISDMLISMRATIKVDNSTTSDNNNNIQITIFSYPENITENSDGSTSYINSPNRLEYIEINGINYPNIKAAAILEPENSNGVLRAETTEDSIASTTTPH
ncbi:hypothetical protein [Candidatus Nitrosocosmicus hydrocola]|uniref:hypothetical protein n=1 Tax=Candidatus Nitrosocosmicus hydrocola TaxID=1826872 RepID=UPI0011E5E65C|nr:hypothetical protein [Candidatus Nitrosocosmicus hydrocola]